MTKKKNDKKTGISLKTFLWRFILTFVVILFIGFGALDIFLGGIFLRKPMNWFYKSQSYPVNVQVNGDIFGYPVNISEVMECKSGRYNNPMVGDEFWGMPNPYVYQFNKDESVTVLKVEGMMICDEEFRKQVEDEFSFITKAFWFSSNEKPAQHKRISMGPDVRKENLKLTFNKAPVGTESSQKYKFTWFSSDCAENKTESSTSYLYTSGTVRVIKEDEWKQINFLRQNIDENAARPYQLHVPKEEIKNINKFPLLNYRLVKTSPNNFKLDINAKISGVSLFPFDQEVDIPFSNCNKFQPSYAPDTKFEIDEDVIQFKDFDMSSATMMTTHSQDGYVFFYFPKSKLIIQFHKPKPNMSLYPSTPVIMENK